MVAFLDSKLTGLHVFEWGSGGSTVWFAQRAASVLSIEHDSDWYKRVCALLRFDNTVNTVYVYHIPLGPDYWNTIADANPAPDLALIDGRHRKACADAIRKLPTPPAAILWDDAQRDYYQCSMHFDGYQHRDFLDDIHPPRTSRLFVRTDGPLAHWLTA